MYVSKQAKYFMWIFRYLLFHELLAVLQIKKKTMCVMCMLVMNATVNHQYHRCTRYTCLMQCVALCVCVCVVG